MAAVAAVILLAAFAWFVLHLVRGLTSNAPDDDVDKVEFEETPPLQMKNPPPPPVRTEYIQKLAKESAESDLMFQVNEYGFVMGFNISQEEKELFKELYHKYREDFLTLTIGRKYYLLVNTASYGKEVTLRKIQENGQLVFTCAKGYRYWLQPDQVSFYPPNRYFYPHFDSEQSFFVYWPGTPLLGREFKIQRVDKDYVWSTCGMMLTHYMVRMPLFTFPEMQLPSN